MQQTLWGWKLYLKQPILPASIAYIMLYFNAVLGPGGLMTAFLASRGLSGTAAALFRCALQPILAVHFRSFAADFSRQREGGLTAGDYRGGCAAMGFVGTWAGRLCISRLGLLRAGVAAITFQARLFPSRLSAARNHCMCKNAACVHISHLSAYKSCERGSVMTY